MSTTGYTFLPWARRGLAGRAPAIPLTSPLPAEARVAVGLTVSGMPESRRELSLYGPGDVLGIDPGLIVRTDPRPGSRGVEPNYLPLIEFDPPDLLWLFTPASSGPDDRLRPWCVLVVVDLAVIRPPRTEADRPLPVLDIPGPLVASELPDLTESWAWAHAQLLAPDGEDSAAALAARPAMNVSRLLAPRRLEARKRYAACLVPAFDAGVIRGLGGEPSGSEMLQPAWPAPAGGDVTLPVYYSWEFSTGTADDFEELARRLRPFPVPSTAGGEPMYLGAAGPELPARPPDDPSAYLAMDGALRSWQGTVGGLTDVPGDVRTALRDTLDAAAVRAASGSTSPAAVLGPPMYGGWHARRHTVPEDGPRWLRELNLDPRARAAAGIGAEIVRQNQDQFMQWCWEQVADVLEANLLLSRSRLSMEALARLHARHFAPLPEDRLLQLTAPLHARTRRGNLTVTASIRHASLPDAADDPALRRLISPQRPVLRRLSRSAGPEASPRVMMLSRLAVAADGLSVNPTDFVPHGLLGIPAMVTLPFDPNADAVDLTPIGMPVDVPTALVNQVRNDTVRVTADPHPRLTRRDDLDAGVLGERHLQDARDLREQVGSPWYSVFDLLSLVRPDERIHDAGTIARLATAVTHVAEVEVILGRPPPPFEALGMQSISASLLARTDPRTSVPSRLATMVLVGSSGTLEDADSGLAVAPTADRVLAAPRIDVPIYSYLARMDPARFLPAVGELPENSITVLKTNPRFVESLLVGLNFEMNRELLWRGFPTDQRGTPFRRFWDRAVGADIPDIHTWADGNGLGSNGPGDAEGQVTLLVRGELLQRYPNACLYAWRAQDGRLLRTPRVPEDLRSPVFAGVLGTDTTFVGFELGAAELAAGDGWFFVISEQPTEPRFGFDEVDDAGTLPPLTGWSAATWEHTGTAPGDYLRITGNPLTGTALGGARFVDHAAHLAAITHQKPMRIAMHAGGLPELVAP